MSKARFDAESKEPAGARRAMALLIEAQAIIDGLDRPEIGARLAEVIDAVRVVGRQRNDRRR